MLYIHDIHQQRSTQKEAAEPEQAQQVTSQPEAPAALQELGGERGGNGVAAAAAVCWG